MFLLYAIVIGVALGPAARRPAVRPRFARLPLGAARDRSASRVQIVLFSGPVSDRVGDLGPSLYVASTAMVLVVVLRNLRIPGMPIVAAGAASNLAGDRRQRRLHADEPGGRRGGWPGRGDHVLEQRDRRRRGPRAR